MKKKENKYTEAFRYLLDEYYMTPNNWDDYKLIKEAVERQEPKYPMHNHHCPNCEYGLPTPGITDEWCSCCFYPPFCPQCGQAIDWEKEKRMYNRLMKNKKYVIGGKIGNQLIDENYKDNQLDLVQLINKVNNNLRKDNK